MAHHSSEDPSPFLADLFKEHVLNMNEQAAALYEKLGATDRFPEGKLAPEDEGEIRFGVTVKDGKVVIAFGKPVAWIGMTVAQARELGQLILERAAEAGGPDER
jgi:hypothetical protein